MRPIDYFERGAAIDPARPFLIGNGQRYSFAAASTLIDDIARGLYAAGFTLGDSIAVYSPNDPLAMLCVRDSMIHLHKTIPCHP